MKKIETKHWVFCKMTHDEFAAKVNSIVKTWKFGEKEAIFKSGFMNVGKDHYFDSSVRTPDLKELINVITLDVLIKTSTTAMDKKELAEDATTAILELARKY